MKNDVENRKRFFGEEMHPLKDTKELYGGISEFRGKKYHVDKLEETEASGFCIKGDGTKEKFIALKEFGYVGIGRTRGHADADIGRYEYEKIGFDEKIKEFTERFKKDEMYSVAEFSSWHRRITNSCYFGRVQFMREHNLREDDKMSPMYFVKITSENDEESKRQFERLEKYYEGSASKYEAANINSAVQGNG